jgi:hypothetical protein
VQRRRLRCLSFTLRELDEKQLEGGNRFPIARMRNVPETLSDMMAGQSVAKPRAPIREPRNADSFVLARAMEPGGPIRELACQSRSGDRARSATSSVFVSRRELAGVAGLEKPGCGNWLGD